MDIWLMRHPAVTNSGICSGQLEMPLDPQWLNRLPTVRALLPQNLPIIWTSPSERCRLVAEKLGGQELRIDDRLHEVNYGKWQGHSWKDLAEDELLKWLDDPEQAVPHGGESGNDLLDRVCESFQAWTEEDRDVLALTHAGWIQALLSILLGTNLAHAFRLDINYFSLSKIVVTTDVIRIAYINHCV